MGKMSGGSELAAIEQAYRDGYRRFLRVAVAMLGDSERGRDAVQEAFARAIRSRGDLRRIESLQPWLWRTLVNICRVEQRRGRLVLFLRHYADLDYERIGAIVGIRRGTVAATLHAAHQKIRQAVTEVPR